VSIKLRFAFGFTVSLACAWLQLTVGHRLAALGFAVMMIGGFLNFTCAWTNEWKMPVKGLKKEQETARHTRLLRGTKLRLLADRIGGEHIKGSIGDIACATGILVVMLGLILKT
jgi:hypothetical protein